MTAWTEETKREAYRRLHAELAPVLERASDADALYRAAVDALHTLPTYDWTGIYVLESPKELVLGPFRGAPTDHVRIPVGRGICGRSAAEDATVLVDDVTAEANYLACSLETRSEIVVPIRVGGRYVAQIDVDSHAPAAFDTVDREALEALAERMGARLAILESA